MESVRLWHEYVESKQTYAQLAVKYGCSIRTIQRKIDAYVVSFTTPKAREVIVLMDTTYWGRNFGVMLFKDSLSVCFIKSATSISSRADCNFGLFVRYLRKIAA